MSQGPDVDAIAAPPTAAGSARDRSLIDRAALVGWTRRSPP